MRRRGARACAPRLAALAVAAAVMVVAGCSAQEEPPVAVWPAAEAVPPEAVGDSSVVEVLTFGSLSRFLAEPVLVRRGGQLVEFVAAADFERWWAEHVKGAYYLPGETAGPGPWAVRYQHNADRRRSDSQHVPEVGPLSQHHVTTGVDGRGVLKLPAGDYVACAHFEDQFEGFTLSWAVAGCEPVTLAPGTVVYVYFAQGSAFIDTGEGTAHDAYLSFVCRHRAGLQPQDPSEQGCPAPPL